MKMKQKFQRRAFTLIEIMVAVAIFALLVAAGLFHLDGNLEIVAGRQRGGGAGRSANESPSARWKIR